MYYLWCSVQQPFTCMSCLEICYCRTLRFPLFSGPWFCYRKPPPPYYNASLIVDLILLHVLLASRPQSFAPFLLPSSLPFLHPTWWPFHSLLYFKALGIWVREIKLPSSVLFFYFHVVFTFSWSGIGHALTDNISLPAFFFFGHTLPWTYPVNPPLAMSTLHVSMLQFTTTSTLTPPTLIAQTVPPARPWPTPLVLSIQFPCFQAISPTLNGKAPIDDAWNSFKGLPFFFFIAFPIDSPYVVVYVLTVMSMFTIMAGPSSK